MLSVIIEVENTVLNTKCVHNKKCKFISEFLAIEIKLPHQFSYNIFNSKPSCFCISSLSR